MTKTAQQQCDDFNQKHSYGTKGWLHMDSGEKKATATRSYAEVSASGHAVIWVNGVSGFYLLDRFEPA